MTMTVLLLSLLACGEPEPVVVAAPPPPAAPAVAPQVARAIELGQAVRAQPTDTAGALASKGGSRAELEGLLYEIAADPALTDAYVAAMR